jgi:tetratricopeptide (TPR) repeat protein
MKNHFNRYFLWLSLIPLGLFALSLAFGLTTLKKREAFAAVKSFFLTGTELQRHKKPDLARSYWEKGTLRYRSASRQMGYYPLIYDGFHYAGNCFHQLGKDDDAIQAYNLALKYHPYSIIDLAGRATAATRLGKYELTIQSLALCNRIYPFNWKISYNLADAYKKTGRLEQALPYFLQAWKQRPNNFPIFLQLVNTYAVLGKIPEAREATNLMARRKLQPKYRKIINSLQKAFDSGYPSKNK